MIRISRSLNWSKTLIEVLFNPYREFRWGPEGSVSQMHSPHLHVVAPGIFSDLLKSVQMLKREWDAESIVKLPHLFIPSKTATLVPEFAVKDLPSSRTLDYYYYYLTILHNRDYQPTDRVPILVRQVQIQVRDLLEKFLNSHNISFIYQNNVIC